LKTIQEEFNEKDHFKKVATVETKNKMNKMMKQILEKKI